MAARLRASIGASAIARRVPAPPKRNSVLRPPAQRGFAGGSPHLDVAERPPVPVGEPGAAAIALAHHVLPGCRGEDRRRQTALIGEVEPGGRALPQPGPGGPALVEWLPAPALRLADQRRVGRRNPDQAAQHLAHVTEVQAGLEVLDEAEHVAFRLAERIPPAAAVMIDDQHLTLAAAILERPPGALACVQLPARHALQHRGATDGTQEGEFGIVGHGAALLGFGTARAWTALGFPSSRSGHRVAGGRQGRRRRRRPRSGLPCRPTGASGSGVIVVLVCHCPRLRGRPANGSRELSARDRRPSKSCGRSGARDAAHQTRCSRASRSAGPRRRARCRG